GRPAFDDLDEAAEPGVGLVAVDDAVVDGQGHISHRQDDDRVVAVDFADGNALPQFPDAEDRGLPLVKDDWRGEQRAGHAMVRDGKASARDFRALELILAGAAGEVVELRADLLQAEPPRIFDHRDDQTLLAERGSDADVDRRRNGDPVLLPPAVDRRCDGHRLGRGFDDVGGVAELDPALSHRRLVRRDGAEVGLEHRGHMRLLGNRARHVLGDRKPHAVVRDVAAAELARLGRGRLADADDGGFGYGPVDVLARDPPVAPGAADPRWIDAVLQARAADGRAEAGFNIVPRRRPGS